MQLNWIRLAVLVALGPPLAGQLPPRIAGVSLGDSASVVAAQLGAPDSHQELIGVVAWDYTARGLTVMWNQTDRRVRVMVLSKREGGVAEGVRVGDPVHVAKEQWGEPTRIRQDGRYWDFVRGAWAATLEIRDGNVITITLQAAE